MAAITTASILKEIERLSGVSTKRPDGCFTSAELGYEMYPDRHGDTAQRLASKFIRIAIRSGLAEFVGRIPMENMCGGTQRIPMYRWTKKGK